jgi:catechol 2,3-dioxygenase-like lactoylglutathione lyase family enzyme
MLGNFNAVANLAVRDIATAREFYEGILGLAEAGSEGAEEVTYRSGASTLFVYRSDYAGTNQATAVTWVVGDQLDAIARALADKGVAFEHYDMPGTTREGDVHVGHGMRVAWFKDPDGNILNIADG